MPMIDGSYALALTGITNAFASVAAIVFVVLLDCAVGARWDRAALAVLRRGVSILCAAQVTLNWIQRTLADIPEELVDLAALTHVTCQVGSSFMLNEKRECSM